MKHQWLWGGLLSVCWAANAAESATSRAFGVTLSTNRVQRFARLDFSFAIKPVGKNPFDPADVDLRVELQAPSGAKVWTPAFYRQIYEGMTGSPARGAEWRYPVGEPVWQARFAPSETGVYQGFASLSDGAGTARSENFSSSRETHALWAW